MSEDVSTKIPTKIMAAKVFELRTQGYSVDEIAEQLGVSARTITRAINSDDSKQLLAEARKRILECVDDAIAVYKRSLQSDSTDRTNAQKAARDILKNFGLLRESVDMNHNFPKPTVIKRADGTEIVLGSTAHNEDNEGEEE